MSLDTATPGLQLELRPYQPGREVSRVTPLVERLATGIEVVPSGCWEWRRGCDGAGYGMIRVEGRTRRVHRVVYELLVGPIPAGLPLDHLCRNPPCCNPKHVEPVTHRTNILRGVGLAAMQAQRTRCPSGHPYDAENTYVLPSRPRARYCRECHRIRRRERYARTGR